MTTRRGVPEANWTKRAPVPVAVAEVGAGQVDGKMYLVGGTAQEGRQPATAASTWTFRYDPALDEWEQCAPLPHALSHVGVTGLDGKLYAIGGLTANVHIGPRSFAFAYDPQEDRWSELPPFSSPRGSLGVAAVDDKVHIFGGRNSGKVVRVASPGAPDTLVGIGTVTTHEFYDPTSGEWREASPLPGPPRDHMGIAVLDGAVHIFGGRINDYSDMLDRHDVYYPGADTWTSAAPLPRPRSAGAFTALEGFIVYAGGECKPGGEPSSPDVFEDVTAYDAVSDAWVDLAPLPQARHAFGAASIDGVAYFAGGALVCGGGVSTDTFALTVRRR